MEEFLSDPKLTNIILVFVAFVLVRIYNAIDRIANKIWYEETVNTINDYSYNKHGKN